jgi:hypothetical protein
MEYMPTYLHLELESIGLSISGCDNLGNVQLSDPDTNNLVPLILAAHNKPLSSDECLSLKAVITNEHWISYVNVRNAPISLQRQVRFKEITDLMYLKIIEEAHVNNTTPDISDWIAAKNTIREQLPYLE